MGMNKNGVLPNGFPSQEKAMNGYYGGNFHDINVGFLLTLAWTEFSRAKGFFRSKISILDL